MITPALVAGDVIGAVLCGLLWYALRSKAAAEGGTILHAQSAADAPTAATDPATPIAR